MTFRYTPKEAEIAARLEVGTRNLPLPVAFGAVILVAAVQAMGWIFGLRIPLAWGIAQVSAAGVAVLAALYAEGRVRMTARSIGKRVFCADTHQGTLVLTEHDRPLYHIDPAAVRRILLGRTCAQLVTDRFALCLPLRVCGTLVEQAEAQGAAVKKASWM